MVAKKDLLTAAQAIDQALQAFDSSGKTLVFESYPGHLRALVGSEKFRRVGLGDRQEMIWEHLRKHGEPTYLVYLFGVRPMDLDEYEVYISSQDSVSGSMDMFIQARVR